MPCPQAHRIALADSGETEVRPEMLVEVGVGNRCRYDRRLTHEIDAERPNTGCPASKMIHGRRHDSRQEVLPP